MRKRFLALSLLVFWLGLTPLAFGQSLEQTKAKAAQGDVAAQCVLGAMYAKGDKVAQDWAQAKAWFEKAASQGYARAQKNLGVMYLKGLGVKKDFAQAKSWFEKAAAQGNAAAQFSLGFMYAQGDGVK